jgi:putative endopeptidase
MKKTLIIIGIVANTVGCGVLQKKLLRNEKATMDVSYMDKSTLPQDDFFQFANGTWVKNNPVPPSESRWGSFNELNKYNLEKLTTLLEEYVSAESGNTSDEQLLADYYASFTDMQNRNNIGYIPIKEQLDQISKIASKKDIVTVVAAQHKKGINSLFYFGVQQDMKNVSRHIASFNQGGIGLPNRDYYHVPEKMEIHEDYMHYIISLMNIIGERNSKEIAQSILDFEINLSKSMLTPSEMRIPSNRYKVLGIDEACESLGSFDFKHYLSLVGINNIDSLNFSGNKHAMNIRKMLEEVDLASWKNYLQWCTINHYSGHLDEKTANVNFDFYGQILSGRKEMKPINERAINEITRMNFGELLGKSFVEKHYSESAQTRIDKMVDNILEAFRERINGLEWMSEETKKQALIKLNAIDRKLGFPEKWKDYSLLTFRKDTYVENYTNANAFRFYKNIKKLNEPVDETEWGMPAHMVNAYYHPLLNEIAFPAGIMQAPFFDDSFEDGVNYGRIGVVIGHELTHGFDDMGSQYGADGTLENWWTKEDRESFDLKTRTYGETFARFCPIEGHCVNPKLTMGENIADLGGLTLAYYAYTKTEEFKEGKARNGFTPAQRFFISFAQLWKINFTDAELKKRIATDPHAPGMYRVNGPLMNCPEFFETFNVKEEDPMRNSGKQLSRIW